MYTRLGVDLLDSGRGVPCSSRSSGRGRNSGARTRTRARGRELGRDWSDRRAGVVHQIGGVAVFGFDAGRLAEDIGVRRAVGFVAAERAVAAGADAVEERRAKALAHDFTGIKLHFFALEVVGRFAVLGQLHARLQHDRDAAADARAGRAVAVEHGRTEQAAAHVHFAISVVEDRVGVRGVEAVHARFGRQIFP